MTIEIMLKEMVEELKGKGYEEKEIMEKANEIYKKYKNKSFK